MPWTVADSEKVALHFMLPVTDEAIITLLGLQLSETTVTLLRSYLSDLDTLFTQMGEVAASDGIKELVGDIVFADGGRTPGLMRRYNLLKGMIAARLGFEYGGQARAYRS